MALDDMKLDQPWTPSHGAKMIDEAAGLYQGLGEKVAFLYEDHCNEFEDAYDNQTVDFLKPVLARLHKNSVELYSMLDEAENKILEWAETVYTEEDDE